MQHKPVSGNYWRSERNPLCTSAIKIKGQRVYIKIIILFDNACPHVVNNIEVMRTVKVFEGNETIPITPVLFSYLWVSVY